MESNLGTCQLLYFQVLSEKPPKNQGKPVVVFEKDGLRMVGTVKKTRLVDKPAPPLQ